MTKEGKKRSGKKGECIKKKKMEERERMEIDGKRYENALRHRQRQNIDLIDEK